MEPAAKPSVEVRTRVYKYRMRDERKGRWGRWYNSAFTPDEIQKVFEDDALITKVRVTYNDSSATEWSFDYDE